MTKNVSLIILTGNTTNGVRGYSLERELPTLGVDSYMIKPQDSASRHWQFKEHVAIIPQRQGVSVPRWSLMRRASDRTPRFLATILDDSAYFFPTRSQISVHVVALARTRRRAVASRIYYRPRKSNADCNTATSRERRLQRTFVTSDAYCIDEDGYAVRVADVV